MRNAACRRRLTRPQIRRFGDVGRCTFCGDGEHTDTLQDPVLVGIAQAYAKSPAQVMLRWALQQGRSVIPTSTQAERIAENIDVFRRRAERRGDGRDRRPASAPHVDPGGS